MKTFNSKILMTWVTTAAMVCCSVTAGLGTARAQTVASAADGNAAHGFASLKTDRVDVRREPGLDKAVAVIFRRAGLPVLVLEGANGWQRVRDAEGTTGWVLGDLVSKRRTALVLAGPDAGGVVPMRATERTSADAIALLEPGLIVGLVGCDGRSCRISASGVRGYVDQRLLWGLAESEVIR